MSSAPAAGALQGQAYRSDEQALPVLITHSLPTRVDKKTALGNRCSYRDCPEGASRGAASAIRILCAGRTQREGGEDENG